MRKSVIDRRSFLTTAGITLAGTVAMPYVARGASTINLRFAHFAAPAHPANVAATQLASQVRERTSGAVKITIFPNNALGDPGQQTQQIKAGVIDMGLPTQAQLDKFEKAFAVVPLPFLFNSREEAFKVLDGPAFDWMAPLSEKQGLKILRHWDYGFRNVTNNRQPINVPDDLKGLKIRTPPEVQIASGMEVLGAIVSSISLPEVYLALSQGVVDGEENPIAVIYYNKYYEVQKHLALTRHVYNSMVLTINTGSWNKLSPEQQTILQEEGVAAGDFMRKLIGDQENDQIAKVEAAGMKVTRPDPAPFRARMEAAYEKCAAYAGEDNVARMRDIVAKVRAG